MAFDLYRAMDMTFWLPQAEAALALARAVVLPIHALRSDCLAPSLVPGTRSASAG